MKKAAARSPFERDTWKRIQADSELAAEFFGDLSERPIAVQFAVLRRLRGMTQEKMASRLHRRQNYVSKLEQPGLDHLISHYARAVKFLHGRLAIIPDGAKLVYPGHMRREV
ncbi:MAG: helix-turn-helix transcriptional regulator [Elusimicrobia bacterium]|nr:helix-turn-helix transcriptional regulator [Elusimicrobiota bacterium]